MGQKVAEPERTMQHSHSKQVLSCPGFLLSILILKGLSDNSKLWRAVCFTAATRLSLSFSGNVWRMRSELTELAQNTTDDSHYNQDHRRGEDRSRETQKQRTQLSCRRPGSPTAMYYRSGERARITMRPQTKYARPQGTPSPQISITFGHFNYQPIIWHRGPRPRAHWYMCTDVDNPRIVTTTPPFQ